MGQEKSKQIQQSFPQSFGHQKQYESIKNIEKLAHEGLLKISSTPFKNCHQIEFRGGKLFLQKTRISLKELLRNKIRLRKIFSENQVWQIIKDITYSLAYLESISISYPNLIADNIYFIDGNFKLVPPQIINENNFQLVRNYLKNKLEKYAPISPEMVIGIRCQQNEITEKDILFKGNVFEFGLLMLQICTLKSSSDCYDLTNYDILGDVLGDRISQIEQKYSSRLVRVIANMLDYDFDERMTPKELSIYISREIQDQNDLQPEQQPQYMQKNIKLQENLGVSVAASRVIDEPIIITTKSRKITGDQHIINGQKKENPYHNVSFSGKVINETGNNKYSCRLNQIKQKIQRQKLKIQIPEQKTNNKAKITYQKGLRESKSQAKSVNKNLKANKKQPNKYLPNPYLNHHYEQPRRQLYNNERSYENLSPSRNFNEPKYQYPREQIANCQGISSLSSQRDRSINLKYKYNLDPQNLINFSPVRERRNDQAYCKKINEDYCPKDYHYGRVSEFHRQQEGNENNMKNLQQNKHVNQQKKGGNIQKKVLQQKDNNFSLYERHQTLQFQNKGKKVETKLGHKRAQQSQQMQKIRVQIEKSKKIMQQVRKSEQQYKDMAEM